MDFYETVIAVAVGVGVAKLVGLIYEAVTVYLGGRHDSLALMKIDRTIDEIKTNLERIYSELREIREEFDSTSRIPNFSNRLVTKLDDLECAIQKMNRD